MAVFVYSEAMSPAEGRSERPAAPQIVPVPDSIARDFLNGSLTKQFKEAKVFEGGHSIRCFEKEVAIAGFPGARLRIEYEGSVRRVIDFYYVTVNPMNNLTTFIATMTLEASDPYALKLPHRKVEDMTERGRGIGSALLKQAEQWITQVATLSQRPVTVSADTGQWSVIRWLCDKHGFEPVAEDRAAYEDLNANVMDPNRYFIDVEGRLYGRRPSTIFSKDENGRLSLLPIRITLRKIIEPATSN